MVGVRSMGAWRRWIGWQGGKGQTLGLLLEAAALVAFAEWAAPQARDWLREMALLVAPAVRDGRAGDIALFVTALCVLGPLAAGEALAEWAGWAGPLLRPLPFLLGCLAWVALRRGVALALRWAMGPRSLRECLLGLPPLPPTRRQRQLIAVPFVATALGLTCILALTAYSALIAEDLVVGNTVWQVRSALDAASLTVEWAAVLLLGLPAAIMFLAMAFVPVIVWGLCVLWVVVGVPMARRRWWRERLASGEPVLLTPERAEWWVRRRRWTPRFLLAWVYGGSQAVEALDRAAAEALAREVRA